MHIAIKLIKWLCPQIYVDRPLNGQMVQTCPKGMALFVIHGIGTGKLKARVLHHLGKHSLVKRLDAEEKSGGGCTIVHLKL